jgi:hypothetical protein
VIAWSAEAQLVRAEAAQALRECAAARQWEAESLSKHSMSAQRYDLAQRRALIRETSSPPFR